MGLNNSDKILKAAEPHRRYLVAHLRVRHLSQRDIVKALAQQGDINPISGKPWSLGQINADVKAIEKMWREEMLKDMTIHKAAVHAEITEVKRQAWADQSMDLVLRSLQQERALLGLDAPRKLAPTDPTGTKEYAELSDEERAIRIAAILDAAAKRRAGQTPTPPCTAARTRTRG